MKTKNVPDGCHLLFKLQASQAFPCKRSVRLLYVLMYGPDKGFKIRTLILLTLFEDDKEIQSIGLT